MKWCIYKCLKIFFIFSWNFYDPSNIWFIFLLFQFTNLQLQRFDLKFVEKKMAYDN